MDDDAKARLDGLLQQYDDDRAGRDRGETRGAEDSRRARERFVDLRDSVIEPTMREVGEYLKSRGHDYEIQSRETRDIGAGQNDEPSIALAIYPRGYSRAKLDPAHTPTLTFRSGDAPGRLRTQSVKTLPGRSAIASVGRSYALDAVTPEVVRNEIMELLESVLGPARR